MNAPLPGLPAVDEPLLHALPSPEQQRAGSLTLSVLIPVFNERYLVRTSVARVLALSHPSISSLEVIAVDDRSTDGSWEVLVDMARADERIRLIRHDRNLGKGAAIRTALGHAAGDVCVIHDADMEYNPADIPALLKPLIEEGADAVYGSRYMAAPYRRALGHMHSRINRILTTLCNCCTDLDLTDMETCYKAVNRNLLQSIPLRSNDFRIEVELTLKLAKRRARIFEVPIRYLPRTQEEGKKIRPTDALRALAAMAWFFMVDDIHLEDRWNSSFLGGLTRARRFNRWLASTIRPYVGERILELNSGFGMLTSQFIPRLLYLASDVDAQCLEYLRAYSFGKPYLRAVRLDAGDPLLFRPLERQFDTVLAVNVLESSVDQDLALRNVRSALAPGGRAVIVVTPLCRSQKPGVNIPQSATELQRSLETAGFRVEKVFDFNRVTVPFWFLNARVLRRTRFSRAQLKAMEVLMPLITRADRMLPWRGFSLVGVAVNPPEPPQKLDCN